jgi:aspartate racemase
MLGVLGGMGPAAGVEFMSRLIKQTAALRDQDHVPAILWSDPRVPDRSTAILAGSNEPLPWLERGVRGLQQAGCTRIVMPCNTAHFWYNDLMRLGTPITHIVDAVAEQLRELNVEGTVAVLGTQATMSMNLYQSRMTEWDCITPKGKTAEQIQSAIDMIKAGYIEDSCQLIRPVIQDFVQKGAQAVVLGCTELPLAITQSWWLDIPVVNSIDALVSTVTCWPKGCR